MTGPKKPSDLTKTEVGIIRLVARGKSNSQIADLFGVTTDQFSHRLSRLHQAIGTTAAKGEDGNALPRVRMTAYAYEHGIVKPSGGRSSGDGEALETVPAELAAAMVQLALSILADKPRGDLRWWARQVVTAARVNAPGGARRGRPVAVPDGADDEQAA